MRTPLRVPAFTRPRARVREARRSHGRVSDRDQRSIASPMTAGEREAELHCAAASAARRRGGLAPAWTSRQLPHRVRERSSGPGRPI